MNICDVVEAAEIERNYVIKLNFGQRIDKPGQIRSARCAVAVIAEEDCIPDPAGRRDALQAAFAAEQARKVMFWFGVLLAHVNRKYFVESAQQDTIGEDRVEHFIRELPDEPVVDFGLLRF